MPRPPLFAFIAFVAFALVAAIRVDADANADPNHIVNHDPTTSAAQLIQAALLGSATNLPALQPIPVDPSSPTPSSSPTLSSVSADTLEPSDEPAPASSDESDLDLTGDLEPESSHEFAPSSTDDLVPAPTDEPVSSSIATPSISTSAPLDTSTSQSQSNETPLSSLTSSATPTTANSTASVQGEASDEKRKQVSASADGTITATAIFTGNGPVVVSSSSNVPNKDEDTEVEDGQVRPEPSAELDFETDVNSNQPLNLIPKSPGRPSVEAEPSAEEHSTETSDPDFFSNGKPSPEEVGNAIPTQEEEGVSEDASIADVWGNMLSSLGVDSGAVQPEPTVEALHTPDGDVELKPTPVATNIEPTLEPQPSAGEEITPSPPVLSTDEEQESVVPTHPAHHCSTTECLSALEGLVSSSSAGTGNNVTPEPSGEAVGESDTSQEIEDIFSALGAMVSNTDTVDEEESIIGPVPELTADTEEGEEALEGSPEAILSPFDAFFNLPTDKHRSEIEYPEPSIGAEYPEATEEYPEATSEYPEATEGYPEHSEEEYAYFSSEPMDMPMEMVLSLFVRHPEQFEVEVISEEIRDAADEFIAANWQIIRMAPFSSASELDTDASEPVVRESVTEDNSFELDMSAVCSTPGGCSTEMDELYQFIREEKMDQALASRDLPQVRVYVKGDEVAGRLDPVSESSSSGLSIGVIAGIAVGGVAAVSLLVLGIVLIVRRGDGSGANNYDAERGYEDEAEFDERSHQNDRYNNMPEEPGSFLISNFGGSPRQTSEIVPWMNSSQGSGARGGAELNSSSFISVDTAEDDPRSKKPSMYQFGETTSSSSASELGDLDLDGSTQESGSGSPGQK